MKKLFALLLALTMLFLTACNNTPSGLVMGTDDAQNTGKVSELELKDTIIYTHRYSFLDLPSRVIYEEGGYIRYFSKADGNGYIYCFDPLCEHSGGTCLGNPDSFDFSRIFLINNRFYYHTGYGQIISFSFDGTDMKTEYNTDYGISTNPWGQCFAVAPYIYIDQRSYASEDGKAHTLRFNVETGEPETTSSTNKLLNTNNLLNDFISIIYIFFTIQHYIP